MYLILAYRIVKSEPEEVLVEEKEDKEEGK